MDVPLANVVSAELSRLILVLIRYPLFFRFSLPAQFGKAEFPCVKIAGATRIEIS